jgi:hypothetical protein
LPAATTGTTGFMFFSILYVQSKCVLGHLKEPIINGIKSKILIYIEKLKNYFMSQEDDLDN